MNSSSRITTTCDDFLSSIAYDASNEMNARARSVHLLEARLNCSTYYYSTLYQKYLAWIPYHRNCHLSDCLNLCVLDLGQLLGRSHAADFYIFSYSFHI